MSLSGNGSAARELDQIAKKAAQNEVLIRYLFKEILNGGNLNLVEGVVAENSTDHGPSMVGVVGGVKGFSQTIGRLREALPDVQFTIEDIVTSWEKAAVRWTATGTMEGALLGLEPTGKHATITGTIIYKDEEGRITESWGNYDALGMLVQFDILSEEDIPKGKLY